MTDRVTDYAERVAAGLVPCGQLHRLACERHLHDLNRQNKPDFPYYWDEAAAQRILDFAETLTLSEGDELKSLRLLDCQAFDMLNV